MKDDTWDSLIKEKSDQLEKCKKDLLELKRCECKGLLKKKIRVGSRVHIIMENGGGGYKFNIEEILYLAEDYDDSCYAIISSDELIFRIQYNYKFKEFVGCMYDGSFRLKLIKF